MTIWVARYELQPKSRLSAIARPGPRRGALLRIDDGFADVHPWPELGDAPLDEQLALLARGELTALTRASLYLASIDGDARRGGRSLFDGLQVPQSHWPADAGDAPPAFDTVKLKAGPSTSAAELERFAGKRLRLDFNNTLSEAAFASFVESLPAETRASLDFFEDPFPYDAGAWADVRERLGVRLALDRGESASGVDVLVVKPAVRSGLPEFSGSLVITSYMDHPIGVLGAAFVAAQNASRIDARCGLMTHLLYEPDAFSERLKVDGARLVPRGGPGLGCEDLLERLPWMRLT